MKVTMLVMDVIDVSAKALNKRGVKVFLLGLRRMWVAANVRYNF
jgi:hypothetical protein